MFRRPPTVPDEARCRPVCPSCPVLSLHKGLRYNGPCRQGSERNTGGLSFFQRSVDAAAEASTRWCGIIPATKAFEKRGRRFEGENALLADELLWPPDKSKEDGKKTISWQSEGETFQVAASKTKAVRQKLEVKEDNRRATIQAQAKNLKCIAPYQGDRKFVAESPSLPGQEGSKQGEVSNGIGCKYSK